jgi:hypothetical protein
MQDVAAAHGTARHHGHHGLGQPPDLDLWRGEIHTHIYTATRVSAGRRLGQGRGEAFRQRSPRA